MKKKKKKLSNNNYPFYNQIKQLKFEFKQLIDNMSDEEFIDFSEVFCDFLIDMGLVDEENELEDLPF